jgi:FkbM family methyltransferase
MVMRRFIEPGMTFYDVGANFGFYSALCSSLVGNSGRVIGFEPNPMLHANLQRTFSGTGNSILVGIALGDQSGTASFFIPDDHSCASLSNRTGRPVTSLSVPTARLDDIIEQQNLPIPDFLKVDAEGAETAIFRGAERLLREHSPVVMYEDISCFGHRFEATRLLRGWGYSVDEIREDGSLGPVTDRAWNLVARKG